jgi:hypothetical protein
MSSYNFVNKYPFFTGKVLAKASILKIIVICSFFCKGKGMWHSRH